MANPKIHWIAPGAEGEHLATAHCGRQGEKLTEGDPVLVSQPMRRDGAFRNGIYASRDHSRVTCLRCLFHR